MPARSPARILAPLALAVGLVALVTVIATSGGGGGGGSSEGSSPAAAGRIAKRAPAPRRRRFYVIRQDDLLSTIAARTHVSVARIQSLNPGLDPQGLVPGQRIRLRP